MTPLRHDPQLIEEEVGSPSEVEVRSRKSKSEVYVIKNLKNGLPQKKKKKKKKKHPDRIFFCGHNV